MWAKEKCQENSLSKDIPSMIYSLGARLPEKNKTNLQTLSPEWARLISTNYVNLDSHGPEKTVIGGPAVISLI